MSGQSHITQCLRQQSLLLINFSQSQKVGEAPLMFQGVKIKPQRVHKFLGW